MVGRDGLVIVQASSEMRQGGSVSLSHFGWMGYPSWLMISSTPSVGQRKHSRMRTIPARMDATMPDAALRITSYFRDVGEVPNSLLKPLNSAKKNKAPPE